MIVDNTTFVVPVIIKRKNPSISDRIEDFIISARQCFNSKYQITLNCKLEGHKVTVYCMNFDNSKIIAPCSPHLYEVRLADYPHIILENDIEIELDFLTGSPVASENFLAFLSLSHHV